MTETESDDFWTATEDEHSTMDKVRVNKFLTTGSLTPHLPVSATATSTLDGTEGSKGNQALDISCSFSPCSLSSPSLLLLHRAAHPSYQQFLPLQ